MAGLIVNCYVESRTGHGTASSSPMTKSDKEWVHQTFGRYKDNFEDLLNAMMNFAKENFVYDKDYDHCLPLQNFNFYQFRNDKFHGVCYQFAKWAQAVVGELYKDDIQAFVVDVRVNGKFNSPHSYNYFIYEGRTYFVDFTAILHHDVGGCIYCYNSNLDMSIEQYTEEVLKDTVFRIN
jgi:hypothetical protein